MESEKISTTPQQEQYLYLYTYEIEEKRYTYFDYFKHRQEAEATILFYNAGAPYIKTISLEECPYGVNWRGLHIPYKKSDWQKMHHMTN
jgi:hypothetical protein